MPGALGRSRLFCMMPVPKTIEFSWRLAVAGLLACAVSTPLAAETFSERMAPCVACHGENGQSENPDTPSLGGQTAPYALIQLYLFRSEEHTSELQSRQ